MHPKDKLRSEQLRKNWAHWVGIEASIRRYVFFNWHNYWEAEDVLSHSAEIFASRYCGDYPLPRKIAFAKLCCRRAARNLGYWTRKDVASRQYVSLEAVAEVPINQDVEEREHVHHRLQQLERLLSRGCCQQIQEAVQMVLAGHSMKAAAQAVGWSPVRLSRALAELGQMIMGHRPVRRYRRQQILGQMDLFAPMA